MENIKYVNKFQQRNFQLKFNLIKTFTNLNYHLRISNKKFSNNQRNCFSLIKQESSNNIKSYHCLSFQ